ncbi:MAG: hypothetical protein J7599_04960 [Niabella sp.]|nr:hypothetical protein [Niabella sp.]
MNKTPLVKPFLFAFTLLMFSWSFAQKSLKFENGGGPSGNGPTTTDKVVTFYNGDAGVYSPTTTVTYKLSNQQYPSIEGSATTPGLVFGGNISNNNSTPGGIAHYNLMNSLGGSANSQYATNGATPAINIANDYAIEMAGFTDALINSNGSNKVATNTKGVYFADLTLTFNRPVTNPVIHLTGLGGTAAAANGNTQGIAMRLQLTNTGYTVSKLAGNFALSVSGTTIYNSSANYTGATNNSSPSGASGSVLITGANISSLTFRVAMDGDGGGNTWARTDRIAADGFLMAVSLTTYTISGTVFNDANGMTDNIVNGIGSDAGGLYVVVVDANNNVVTSAPVNSDGTYTLPGVMAGDYSVALSTTQPAAGSAFGGATLPDGWVATGEKLGSGTGSDGTADGILTGVSITNANISGASFGIEQPPTTDDVATTIQTPANGSIPQGTITTPPSGNDPEDGALGSGNTVVVTELPSNGTLLYNGNAVTAGQSIDNFDPKLLSFTDLQGGTTSTSFKYSMVDAAGKQSATPGTFKVSWDTPLLVTFGPVSVRVANGALVIDWSTVTEKNVDHFIVELSKDGKNFTGIGTVKSKAINGNSSERLEYRFSKGIDSAKSVAGFLSVVMMGIVLLAFSRRNRLLAAIIIVLGSGIITTSCNKHNTDAVEQQQKLFLRIVQIDKDGGKQVSKTIITTTKE